MLPALIERARQEVVLARVVGKFTVDIGIATLRRRIEGRSTPTTDTSVESLVELSDHARDASTEVIAPTGSAQAMPESEAMPAAAPSGIRPEQLVLPDYDNLPAAHVVAKLASLTQRERDAVEEYEAANRHRRTILGKLDQLRSGR